jgi:hypothetical protein
MKFILALVLLIPISAYSQTFDELIAAGDYTKAEALLKALDSGNWKSPKNKAIYLTNSGALYLNKGRQDLALEKLQEAYNVFQQTNTDHTKEAATCLSWLSLTYNASGKYNQAEDNGLIALQLRQELFGEHSEEVAASYNDLGVVYSQIDADKALEYYEEALAVYQKLHGNEHPKIAIANTNIGGLYRQIELFGDAINNLESASKIWLKIYPNGHPNLGFVYRSLGQTYVKMENSALALTYFEKALDQYRKSFGEKHPDIASTLNQIGAVHLNQQLYNEALDDFQKAIIANVPSFNTKDAKINPSIKEFYNANVLLYSLMLKAQALEGRHFGKTLSLVDLRLALSSLYSCDTLIDNIRHHSTDESDKISLGELANDVYEDGVRLASTISEITASSRKYREVAFYFAEKSKSAVLQESIADAQAKSFAGIPQDLVDQEKNLKSGIAFLAQRLSTRPPAEEEKYLRESLFVLNSEYDAFTKKLEKDYPNYYNLKFNKAFPRVPEIQKTLKADEAIVSYFVGSGKMYQFVITSNRFKSYERTLPVDFDKLMKGMINGIYFRDFNTYAKTAVPLRQVLAPKTKKTDVIIIPSGRMSTLPLEALPMRKPGADFSSTKYLVNAHSISSEFSVGLIAQKRKGQMSSQQSIFLCAPVRFPDKDNLNELPGSESEIKTISSLFQSGMKEVLTYADANEGRIKSNDIAKYNYLHFATHGVVDESDPELSRIYLNENPSDDGHLFAGEIYNLNLNADLAVLSACQTGLGKFSKGEGVIGLSRALVYAGARNLVVSFWSVADESTAELMTDFYSTLLKNPNKGFRYALQQSKIKMIASGKFAEPYYWAPFVLIGY